MLGRMGRTWADRWLVGDDGGPISFEVGPCLGDVRGVEASHAVLLFILGALRRVNRDHIFDLIDGGVDSHALKRRESLPFLANIAKVETARISWIAQIAALTACADGSGKQSAPTL